MHKQKVTKLGSLKLRLPILTQVAPPPPIPFPPGPAQAGLGAKGLNKHKLDKDVDCNEGMPRMNANLAQSRGNPVHYRAQIYRRLMPGRQRAGANMADKPQKNCKEWR